MPSRKLRPAWRSRAIRDPPPPLRRRPSLPSRQARLQGRGLSLAARTRSRAGLGHHPGQRRPGTAARLMRSPVPARLAARPRLAHAPELAAQRVLPHGVVPGAEQLEGDAAQVRHWGRTSPASTTPAPAWARSGRRGRSRPSPCPPATWISTTASMSSRSRKPRGSTPMVARVHVQVVQVEQQPAAARAVERVQELGLAEVLPVQPEIGDVVLQEERRGDARRTSAARRPNELQRLAVVGQGQGRGSRSPRRPARPGGTTGGRCARGSAATRASAPSAATCSRSNRCALPMDRPMLWGIDVALASCASRKAAGLGSGT